MTDHSISCDVCMDLIPLVKDQVASQDSMDLVEEHIAGCESCRHVFEGGWHQPLPSEPNDKKVLSALHRRMVFIGLAVLGFGVLFSVLLTYTAGMFYNFAIMPIIGVLAYVVLRRRSWIVLCSIVVISVVVLLIRTLLEAGSLVLGLYSGVMAGLIYMLFCAVGILIAFLLHYAFGREETK